ncbi:threonine ammonia-lyase [Piscinibacter koreensis]|uniref:Threonine ammonia-lyase n=1 Tax=Piscinibacter koreensis TaxID=2742824 RepID=A0A7Y6NNQ3_9BURK|nr:threonine ammonia-lyase [Schlegelella koreensis]NUZ06442.1 threonine ammonia-lyase [Schlegelella koreensis]
MNDAARPPEGSAGFRGGAGVDGNELVTAPADVRSDHSVDAAPPRPGVDDVRAAAARLGDQILCTPCLESRTLGALVGCDVFLKFENLQFTASFKERGALNKLLQLTPDERARGVLSVSAGNHAQAVAYHAERLGIRATIVMPRFAPSVKIERTRGFGADIVLEGDTFDAAREHGLALAAERGLVVVHPYDDEAVVAGQGTVVLEMLAQQPTLDTLVVPIGGGGLIGGIATAARALRPDIRIVGVQTERFPAAWCAKHGATREAALATIADGIGVKAPGELTLPLIRDLVDDVVLVGEDEIEHAILLLLEIEKTVVEGAGAAGLAALAADPARFAGRRVGVVLSGGNIEPLVLAEIIERGMVKSGRLARLRCDVRDVPGALADVATLLGELGANIDRIQHQRVFTTLSVERVQIEVVVQTRGTAHIEQIVAALHEHGYAAERVI